MSLLSRIHTLNFIALGLHQFEEYACPLGIWFFVHLSQNGLLTKTNIIQDIIYLVVFLVVFMVLTYKVFASMNEKWAYSEEEMKIGFAYAKKHFKNINFEE